MLMGPNESFVSIRLVALSLKFTVTQWIQNEIVSAGICCSYDCTSTKDHKSLQNVPPNALEELSK